MIKNLKGITRYDCLTNETNPNYDGIFWSFPRMGRQKKASMLLICYTYSTVIKLGAVLSHLIKKDPKNT